ncbi:MAG TPA: IS4 family transposase [Candidatus Angelobacter sp.]|nr:IS4 family transposase [Candidatus Angelobacter sp.]
MNLLRQICNFIPDFLVPKLARETGVDKKVRSFSPWSHVVALLYAQLTHSIGLNDVCDALNLHSGPLSSLRGATAPTRNNLSNSNKVRPAELAEQLFWAVFEHLGKLSPRFVSGKAGNRFARKFKRTIHLVDSTTLPLIASCMDWARHRRRKAAAKCHLRLDLQSFLPRFAIVDTARHNDAKRARELCAGIKPGEIVIFDKAYVDFAHLADLCRRMVFWVTRAKDNLCFKVVRRYQRGAVGKILRDDLVGLTTPASRKDFPELLRRIVALVEVDGKEVEMVFLSNNLQWSAKSIVELYRCRWQIWTALLVYLLLRYLSFLSDWSHSFSRLFTLIRTVLWKKWDLLALLKRYGTAGGHFRYLARPEQAYLPGIA